MSKKTFSADVAQLLKLVTHSIYSNKEIFIRELIANANDALQKAKILSAGDAQYLGDQVDLDIKISINKDAKTLTIEDTGIGMNMEDVESHIGTIAKSGTKSFLGKLKDMKDTPNNLVGQFGIGFYSAFMVSDKVEIFTKANESDGVYRSSAGDADYEIKKDKKSDRGTRIVLYLNDESTEYLEDYRIRSLVRKYADYIPVPIMMEKKAEETLIEDKKDNSKKDSGLAPEGQQQEEPQNKELETKNSFEQINSMTAIRQKNKKDVTAEEYNSHYRALAFAQDEPLDVIHVTVEGNINYKAVLYIPKTPSPFGDINDPNREYGPSLYVQNVMIMDKCKDLLPAWMRQIVGVVETPDLPLNVSREILQQSSIMSKIQTSLIKEVIKSLAYIKKENNPDYLEYLNQFGRLLKEGVYYDHERKEEIAGLLYFSSIDHDSITLDEYITQNESALEGLKSIYYLHTPSLQEGKNSPHLHKATKRKLDVVLMTDPIDEYMISMMTSYKDYNFVNIATSDAILPSLEGEQDDKKEIEKTEKEHKDFLAFVISTIGTDKIEKVSFGHDLGDSLAVLDKPEGQPTTQMIRMMKSMGQAVPPVKHNIMINPEHPLVKDYLAVYQQDPQSEKNSLFVSYLYEQALLLDGGEIESMSAFLQKAQSLMQV